jgi:hypothetical protein
VGSKTTPDMNALFERVARSNAIISINHPNAPTGEACMGCGWSPKTTDMHLVSAIEAVNGGSEEGPHSGIPFWDKQLDAGYRPTAIGGSDNHNAELPPDRPGSVGSPTTVIYASELSVKAILAGIRSGRIFIDLTASRDRLLDLSAQKGATTAAMGGDLPAASGEIVSLSIHVLACQGSSVQVLIDGEQKLGIPAAITSPDQTLTSQWQSDGKRHWLRADVVSESGKLQVLGNPVYINFSANQARD